MPPERPPPPIGISLRRHRLRGPTSGPDPAGSDTRGFRARDRVLGRSGRVRHRLLSTDGRELFFSRRADGGENTLLARPAGTRRLDRARAGRLLPGLPANAPHVTPDGSRLFFGCLRLPSARSARNGPSGTRSARPAAAGASSATTAPRWGQPSATFTLTDVRRRRRRVVYLWIDGRYGPPQKLGGGVNAPRVAAWRFIAPDESDPVRLVPPARRPGGEGDLYVCFRRADGLLGARRTTRRRRQHRRPPPPHGLSRRPLHLLQHLPRHPLNSAGCWTNSGPRHGIGAPGRPLNCLVLLGEWFGDIYFAPGRDRPARLDHDAGGRRRRVPRLLPEGARRRAHERDPHPRPGRTSPATTVPIIPSGPQFRKFNENPAVLRFVRDACTRWSARRRVLLHRQPVACAAGLLEGADGAAISPSIVTRFRPGTVSWPHAAAGRRLARLAESAP